MIQIDLPMPDACNECPLNYDFCWCEGMTKEEWKVHEDAWNDQVCEGEHRPEYCPLKEQPEIVRCKDCKKHDTYDCHITYLTTQKSQNDWFCADGERLD